MPVITPCSHLDKSHVSCIALDQVAVIELLLKMEDQILINVPGHIVNDPATSSPGSSIGGTAFTLKLQPEDLSLENLPRKVLKVACQSCGKYTSSIKEWKKHRALVHGDLIRYGVKQQDAFWEGSFGDPTGQYPCPTCRTPFLTPLNRDKHHEMRIVCPMLTCRLCKSFHRNMELHIRTHHSDVSNCVQCDAVNIDDLVAHCDRFHGGYDVTWHEVNLNCFGNGSGFSIQEIILNISLMLPGKNFGSDKSVMPGQAISLLDSLPIYYEKTARVRVEHYLGLPFLPASNHQLTPEIYSNTAVPIYKCRVCGFIGRTQRKRDEMISHAITVHFGNQLNGKLSRVPPYSCPQNGCKHTAERKWTIKQHFFSKHIGKKMLYE